MTARMLAQLGYLHEREAERGAYEGAPAADVEHLQRLSERCLDAAIDQGFDGGIDAAFGKECSCEG